MVLNLVVGTEPYKLNTCIHRTLRSWKNKCVSWILFFTFIAQNLLPPNPWKWLTEPWGSIEPRLRFTGLVISRVVYKIAITLSLRAAGFTIPDRRFKKNVCANWQIWKVHPECKSRAECNFDTNEIYEISKLCKQTESTGYIVCIPRVYCFKYTQGKKASHCCYLWQKTTKYNKTHL